MTAEPISVECPDCHTVIAIVNEQAHVWAALNRHTCRTQPRGNRMSAQPLHPVADTGKRPHPRDLLNHPSKQVARAAQKVLDAVAKLDEAWEADATKAELRAKRDKLKKQLAAVEAELRGAPATPIAVDAKTVRAWAAANGVDCPASGIIPKRVADAYTQAHG